MCATCTCTIDVWPFKGTATGYISQDNYYMYMYNEYTSLILYQGNKHPTLCRQMIVCIIKDGLASNSQIDPARCTKLKLIIPHSSLTTTLEEVIVWLINEDIVLSKIRIELALETILPVDRVFVANVVGVCVRGTRLSTIHSIRLYH